MKNFIFCCFLLNFSCFSQMIKQEENQSEENQEISLLFVGDIMGHSPQINSAYDADTKQYNYLPVFEKISPIIKENDFCIGNLEVTLAGKPFTGYPTFSSPDELASACKESGINIMVTANNHTCDRGKKGILRTISVLDSLQIPHTGSFISKEERENKNLLVLEKNNIKIGLLNYTYGTNGIPIPEPTEVNLIDTLQMKTDIDFAHQKNLDKLIVAIHWGDEYRQKPNENQKAIAHFLFENGVDIVIGSHPHVVQPLEYHPKTPEQKEKLVVYSLGNFVSNQRKPNTDGGIMVKIKLKKEKNETFIAESGYYLSWVHKFNEDNKVKYEILPCFSLENSNFENLKEKSKQEAELFIKNTRNLLKDSSVKEIIPSTSTKNDIKNT